MVSKTLHPFYVAYVVITFLVSLFLAFPFFLLLGISNNKIARHIMWSITHYWSGVWLFIIGMPLKKIGQFPQTGRYVIVANHISYLDTLIIYVAFPRYFRPLGKKEMSSIPVFGFVYKQLVIMVDRSNPHSRARSMKLMWRVLHNEGSIVIFPEGTFNETGAPLKSFYDGAFRLAINTQTAILPVIFPDTVRRWHYRAWHQLTPGSNRAIYLPPIDVTGMNISDTPMLKQKTFEMIKAELKKYK
jgi:1-acyl-sn-glycerol-3-phosphate acyltransferase